MDGKNPLLAHNNANRVLHDRGSQFLDARRNGGRIKTSHTFRVRTRRQNLVDLFQKSKIQKLVGFIENEMSHTV